MKTLTITAEDKLIDNILNFIKSLKNIGNKIKIQTKDDELKIEEDFILEISKINKKG